MEIALALLAGLLIGLILGRSVGRAAAAADIARAEATSQAAEEKAAYVEERLGERFRALSAEALDDGNQRFKEALDSVETQLRDAETRRSQAHAEMTSQLVALREGTELLRREAHTLGRALQRPGAQGRWGELQLRRVVELAGMSRHCDFVEQATTATADGVLRPDMIVHLAGGRQVVVDSKVSIAAYLDAASARDNGSGGKLLDEHARHLRQHVDRLAAKAYWQSLGQSPEFVIMFIPGEAFLAPALERDRTLLEHAIARRVHIATPTTLITMLRTAQFAWQQEALHDNAQAVFDVGRELYERLGVAGRNLDGLGRALGRAVDSYNRTVGSMEARVLVSARKLHGLGVVDGALPEMRLIEEAPRTPSAPELLEE